MGVRDLAILETRRLGDQIELIGDGKFDVAIRITGQLRDSASRGSTITRSEAMGRERPRRLLRQPPAVVPLMICGVSLSSLIPWPCTTRSGQNATLSRRPCRWR